jgi:hypothetical protein
MMRRKVHKQDSKVNEFIAHGGIGLSNTGGFEVQISDDGEQVRVRYSDGECSRWVDVESGGEEDNAHFVDPLSGNDYYFHEIMKY